MQKPMLPAAPTLGPDATEEAIGQKFRKRESPTLLGCSRELFLRLLKLGTNVS